ncbi:histone-like nucleoid-structuring protein Lsr2 [Glycomyces sp. YM15]|uniref:Lsr2 dimerization domain-containing protein n=1 Tax=Glycomyces sp. YM15 TaxID=2800446 RepID=UPI00196260C9|nr:histone-like nucleoid-structuring protein Lsr2 [Glycomyces sp. YM15]
MPPFKDDLDGREADLGITFGIDGVLYRIRLSVEHAADLYELLGPLRERAQFVGLVQLLEPEVPLPAVSFPSGKDRAAAARAWAAARDIDVAASGRVPHALDGAFGLERALEERDNADCDSF